MKIIQVINSFSPGGAEIFVKELSKSLKNKGIDVEIWAMSEYSDKNFEEEFIKELKRNKIKFKNFNKKSHRQRLKIISSLRREILKSKPDIIHAHCESPAFYTAVSCLGTNIFLIQTIHNTIINYIVLQRYFLKRKYQKFVAISEKVKDILIKRIGVPRKKIIKIYNGIDLKKFDLILPKRREGSYIKLINIGRLTEQKDQENLIKSVYLLKRKYYRENNLPFKVFIVGEGKLKKTLIELVKNLKLEKNIEFLGARTDIPYLLSNSDIFVLSSKWEGFPLVILEAMASKLPIISTDVGSIGEIIENGKEGILIPKESPEKLADAIYLLSKDYSLRKELSENAYNKVRNKFSIQMCVKQHLELYKQVITS